MRFRLATWNINSVRLRLDLIERLVKAEQPDILCLQEIKCVDVTFPELPLCGGRYGETTSAAISEFPPVPATS